MNTRLHNSCSSGERGDTARRRVEKTRGAGFPNTARAQARSSSLSRAFILMEIVVALAILVLGMTVIGAQFQTSRSAAYDTERLYRAMLLAESKIAEIDTGLVQPEDEIEEDFGRLFPDYAWRMTIEPTAVDELNFITLQILHEIRPDPDAPFDFDTATVLHTSYAMRATPTRIDLTRDFGMSEEQADKIDEALSGVPGVDSDARDLDPAIFRDLPLEDLIGLLPPLLQALGINLEDVLPMLPPELVAAFEAAQLEAEKGEEPGVEPESGVPAETMPEEPEFDEPRGEAAEADKEADRLEADEEDRDEVRPGRRPRRPGRVRPEGRSGRPERGRSGREDSGRRPSGGRARR